MFERFKNKAQELLSFSKQEKLFVLSAMFCSFFICAGYAIVRPVSNSLFIYSYTAAYFPYAWLAAVPLNFLLVSLYNRYLQKLGCLRMFLVILLAIIGFNLLGAFYLKEIFWLPFVFYIWKEIYVLLLFQQLWSVIHSTTAMSKAKYLYGILFAIGGAGGVFGSAVPGFLAVKMGSESLLLLSLPVSVALLFSYIWLLKGSDNIRKEKQFSDLHLEKTPSLLHGIKLIANSKYLLFILLIVVSMQFASTIIDYQFNQVLEKEISAKDLRTQYAGRILGIVNFLSMGMQVFGTFLLVHFLGIRRSHFLVPCTLCLNAIAFLIFPIFGVVSFTFITIKSFDFSIFGIIKEMLYIPLKVDEKFRAKAVIDVFAYRTSKAIASFLILLLQFFIGAEIISHLAWWNLCVFILWGMAVASMLKKQDVAFSNLDEPFPL